MKCFFLIFLHFVLSSFYVIVSKVKVCERDLGLSLHTYIFSEDERTTSRKAESRQIS